MNRAEERPVAIGLRLYRTLAHAFPQEFRIACGDELAQAGEDAIEPVWGRRFARSRREILARVCFNRAQPRRRRATLMV